MLRRLAIGALLTMPLSAGSVDLFTDAGAWSAAAQADAAGKGKYIMYDEVFAGNKISTPLAITTESYGGGDGLGFIAYGAWNDSVGKYASLGGRTRYQDATIFYFEATLYGVGFDLQTSGSTDNGGLDAVVHFADGSSVDWKPAGTYNDPFCRTGCSAPFSGFTGLASTSPIQYMIWDGGGTQFAVQNLMMADPVTPEPASIGLVAGALIGLGVWRKKK